MVYNKTIIISKNTTIKEHLVKKCEKLLILHLYYYIQVKFCLKNL